MVANPTDEAAALDHDVHRWRHDEFYATTESMDFNLLILCNSSISQIHSDASAESVETGTVEHFTTIDVLIAAIVHATTDALAVFTNR